jgi:hypothetical protein
VEALNYFGGVLQQAPGFLARILYSVVLVILAAACLYEMAHVWFDRSLQLRNFAYVKDGQDVPASGATFARLLEQQQRALYDMYQGGRGGDQEIFSNPLDIRDINLGQIDASVFADVKLEAQGVNIGSLIAALRRWVSSPNEITGTVNHVGGSVYVTAVWLTAPVPDSQQTASRNFLPLLPYSDLQAASFGLACRIFYVQVGARHALFRTLSEEDFCAFSRAFQSFQNYLTARVADPNSGDLKKHLDLAKAITGQLLERKTTFPYAYKLAAYVQLEEKPLGSLAKEDLDRAQGWLAQYFAELDKYALKDERSKARFDFLAARPAPIPAPVAAAAPPPTVAPTAPTRVAPRLAPSVAPGASVSSTEAKSAASICCIVELSGRRYVLTADYTFQGEPLNHPVVSPAVIDGGDPKKPVAVLTFVYPRAAGQPGGGGVALAALNPNVRYVNTAAFGHINGVGPAPTVGSVVRMVGRTSGLVEGKVLGSQVSARLQVERPLLAENMLLVERISKPGDGGAPVLDSSNRLVGLVYGGSERVTLVLPLADLFEKLALSLPADQAGSNP